jgi:hypothetical protein
MEDKMALHLHPSDGKRDKELTQPIPVGLITISLAKNFYIDLNFIISHPQVRIEIQTHTEKYPEHARTKKMVQYPRPLGAKAASCNYSQCILDPKQWHFFLLNRQINNNSRKMI